MGYFADGLFTGFLASVKETGRRFKNGAKELVEDFISGFNGHGWKLWKRGDSWRLELDELMVRKSFQAFELIINQITAIKGSQAITQGHAKIKDVTIVESADVYREVVKEVYALDFSSSNWLKVGIIDSNSLIITHNKLKFDAINNTTTVAVLTGDIIPAMTVEISNLTGVGGYEYFDNDGNKKNIYFEENGRYELPYSNMPPNPLTQAGISIEPGGAMTVKQLPLRTEITETITQEPCYRIQIDDELNSIVEYDLIRCQKGDKFYYVQVGSVFQYYINIPTSEFEANEEGVVLNAPASGDEIVQFGNASHQDKYANRHSAIYLHVDEDEPAIDLMTDVYSKDWNEGNILKTRLGGNLPGTDGDRGFYCVNGKLLFVDENGDTISVINPDGSASFAYGKVSWTKRGDPYFYGTIIAGKDKGERIQISAENSNIVIYNKNNVEVARFEGNSYKLEDFWGGQFPALIQKPLPVRYALENQTLELNISYQLCEPIYTPNESTILKYALAMGVSLLYGDSSCYLKTRFEIRNFKNIGDTEYTVTVIEEINYYAPENATMIGSENIITLPKGYNTIYWVGVLHRANTSQYAAVKLERYLLEISATTYLARYFGNGLILGSSSNNYGCIINKKFESNLIGSPDYVMNYDFISYYAGLRVTDSRVINRQRGRDWGLVGCALLRGILYGSNTGFGNIDCLYETWPSVTKEERGTYKITYPESWRVNGTTYILTTLYDSYTSHKTVSITINVVSNDSRGFILRCNDHTGALVDVDAIYIEVKYI